jgi:hypothetical protein
MSSQARELGAVLERLAAVEAGNREILAELKRRRKRPRERAAKVARRAIDRVASLPVTDLDVAKAERYMRRRR